MKRSIAVALFTLLCFTGLAQEKLFPNKNWVNRRRLREETYTMKWYLTTDSVRREMGSIKTTVKVLKKEGKISIVQLIRLPEKAGSWIDSTMVNLYDYSPVYHSSSNAQRNMRLRFTRSNVDVLYVPAGKAPISVNESVGGGFFDSNFYPFFFQWVDLYPDYTAQINIYDYSPEKHGVLKAWIRKVEEVEYKAEQGTTTKAWKLTVQDEIVPSATSTYYVATKDHRLLQIDIDMGAARAQMIRD